MTFIEQLPVTDLPGNEHYTDPGDPVRVTSSKFHRISWIGVIDAGDPDFAAFAATIPEQFRPAGTFGVAGLESQEHSTFWFGPADVITGALDTSSSNAFPDLFRNLTAHGLAADGWPQRAPWTEAIPARTWHPGGSGVIASYAFAGDPTGQVVVYEITGLPSLLSNYGPGQGAGPRQIVTWHCTRCHVEGDSHDRWESGGPSDRAAACRAARSHLRPGRCTPREAWWDDTIATIEDVVGGRPRPGNVTGLHASRCASKPLNPDAAMAQSSCAEILHARAAMAAVPAPTLG